MRYLIFSMLFCIFGNISKAQTNPCGTDLKDLDYRSIPADTTIRLENGAEITFNRCEFFDIRDCIDMKEIVTVKELQASGLTTLDNNNNPLETGGMIIFKINGEDCPKTCLTVPARIRLPLRGCLALQGGMLYTLDSTGRWRLNNTTPYKTVIINGQPYFEFYAKCNGGYNADKPKPSIKVKLKAKGIREFTNVNIYSRCPLQNMNFAPSKRKRITYVKVFCQNPDSLFLEANGIGKNGENANIHKSFSQLRSRYTKTACDIAGNRIMRRILGIFGLKERRIYRKYIVE